ncbi:hypothetical protein TRFO_17009 [Tritrichomonas foetus]|uniref:Protein kinase domain-containing protein n=1 Tax=Tritrichomonas foetus TaxID=1144522 RepID=A0A1J4KNT5_9EUKA|nr:hypothetical protein TRFO_17009 [Tritrichomonas foetus]|eukprot:OHT12953.1 hypothetical protein TRFO_17009 [Tritrichomonas foetus]
MDEVFQKHRLELSHLSKYEIKPTHLTFKKSIGVGSFGEVYSGSLKSSNEKVAIKKMHKSEFDQASGELYLHEVLILSRSKHDFILPFIGFTKISPYCIVTKYICNDSLYAAIREDPKKLNLNATEKTLIAYGVANALCYLHKMGIVHRDIKAQNILLDENKLPILCDFGSSRFFHSNNIQNFDHNDNNNKNNTNNSHNDNTCTTTNNNNNNNMDKNNLDLIQNENVGKPENDLQMLNEETYENLNEKHHKYNLKNKKKHRNKYKKEDSKEDNKDGRTNNIIEGEAQINEMKTSECGTPNYMAPEFIKGENYTEKVDVYSYAMVLWEILTGQLPFFDLAAAQVIFAVIIKHQRPEIPENTPKPLSTLISRCWRENPEERPSFTEIVSLFENGEIMFEGCDSKHFYKKIEKYRKKRKGQNFGTVPRYSKKICDEEFFRLNHPNKHFFMTDKVKTLSSFNLGTNYSQNLLTGHLSMLQCGNSTQISSSLSFIERHLNDPNFCTTKFWPPILGLLLHGQPNIRGTVQKIALKLCQSEKLLSHLSEVDDLHVYVTQRTLDLFLYVVCFKTDLITMKVVNSLFDIISSKECELKAITLLAKIQKYTTDNEIYKSILNYFKNNVFDFVDSPAGGIIIRVLNNNDVITDEMIKAYFFSKNNSNCVSAYHVLFSKSDKPNLLKVPTLLEHIVSYDSNLRNASYDFILKFASQVEGNVLQQIIDSLLTSVVRFENTNKAILLLCRYATVEERAKTFLLPGISNIWLYSAPEKSAQFMRLFIVLFKQKKIQEIILKSKETVTFLKSVVISNNPDAFLAVCWTISNVSKNFAQDFILRINESEITEKIIQSLLLTRDAKTVSCVCKALSKIANYSYSSSFLLAIPHLLEIISNQSSLSIPLSNSLHDSFSSSMLNCLKLIEKMTKYNETMEAFIIDGNAFNILSKYQAPNEESKRIIRNIKEHLKTGLNLPI